MRVKLDAVFNFLLNISQIILLQLAVSVSPLLLITSQVAFEVATFGNLWYFNSGTYRKQYSLNILSFITGFKMAWWQRRIIKGSIITGNIGLIILEI